ncbi:hypothetical protein INT46_003250 [Mucor plumbeus]|uniref:Ima1 N-terminal domain-containing protein n=1 Tax=Mucor plumbeus TaxID=97098 RepID=A0A8H7UMK8_9FUNG|nr:hypothetical protein INT46_003250 [Mucor plumbeus]
MSSYITHKRPTVKEILLNYIGFGDIPKKVNCWYCCQDSFILPGSKNTVNHWYCNLCESTNIRDKNGEIADPTPFEALNIRNVPAIERTASTININSANTLCSDCEANQETIYHYLAEYIPDESDPTYEIKFNNVDHYKKTLHQRFKLCSNCQDKITKLNEDQRAYMRQQRFIASVKSSSTSTPPAKPSKHAFYLQGLIWAIVHFWSIFFLGFCKGWHHLLKETAVEKLVNYKLYKISQKILIVIRLTLFALIVLGSSKKIELIILSLYATILISTYSLVKCSVWPYALIGKNSRSNTVIEEEEDGFVGEPMDIVPDEVLPPPLQEQYQQQQQQQQYQYQYQYQQQTDAVDSIVNGLHQIAF